MLELSALISTGLAFLIVAASPGPANLSNATIAMRHGRRTSVVYGLGLSCGLVFWGLVAASGLGAILRSSLYVLPILKALGGLYLLWLALLSMCSARQAGSSTNISPGVQRWFVRGLLLNLSNPKSVIAWMAALSVGLHPGSGTQAIVTASLLCIGIGFANNAAYSLLFSFNGMMSLYSRAQRWIDGVAAALFTLAGLGLIRSAFTR